MTMKAHWTVLPLAAVMLALPASVPAQTSPNPPNAAQGAAPRQSGTVKAVAASDFVLTTPGGQDIAVTVPSAARILLVDPTTRDVKTAQQGSMANIAIGDKVIVSGTVGDTGQSTTATRVYLLKSGAIAAMHAQEQAEWAHSVGGIVKTVDAATGAITAVNGSRSYTVDTSASTVVRRYAGASVRFEDAVKSTVGAIQPGDQIQARGQRSADGMAVTADEIVTGSFSNFSGTLTAVDASAGTVTLKDLATKRTVTVAVSGQTNVRKLPAGFGAGGAAAAGAPAGTGNQAAGSRPATGSQEPASTDTATGQNGQAASRRPGVGRMDLSRVISRLPTGSVADLKQGDAVMIVASNSASGNPVAITLLSGVEQILASSPAGQTTLSPWSLGGGEGETSEGGGGSAGPGR